MRTDWFRGLIRLTQAEVSQVVRAPPITYFLLGIIGFIGFVYWLMSTYALGSFVDFTYVMLPIFVLAMASTRISRERESGFAGVLFTYPVESSQYYAAKFLSLQLMGALYLLVLVPFDVLIVYFGGPGWAQEILARAGWTLLTTLFVGALGLLLSASLGRRSTLSSVSLGFTIAMMLVFGPFIMVQYVGVLDPSDVPTVLALLHVSPVMGAMDIFHSHGLALSEPLVSAMVTAILSVFLFVAGLLLYSRFQSPEGWEAPRRVRVCILTLVLVVLVALPIAVPYAYTRPETSQANSIRVGEISLFIWGIQPVSGTPRVGTTFDALLSLSLSNNGSAPITVNRLGLRWHSEYFAFNVTSAEVGPLAVPPVAGGEDVHIELQLRITSLRLAALGTSEFSVFGFTPVLVEVLGELQGVNFTYAYQYNSLRAVGPEYVRETAWAVVGVLTLAVLSVRAHGLARWRRK